MQFVSGESGALLESNVPAAGLEDSARERDPPLKPSDQDKPRPDSFLCRLFLFCGTAGEGDSLPDTQRSSRGASIAQPAAVVVVGTLSLEQPTDLVQCSGPVLCQRPFRVPSNSSGTSGFFSLGLSVLSVQSEGPGGAPRVLEASVLALLRFFQHPSWFPRSNSQKWKL